MTWIKDHYAKQARKRARKAHAKFLGLKKTPLPSVSFLAKKLKSLLTQVVMIRDKRANNSLCLTCNVETIYAAGHIIPASDSLNTRYDPLNLYGVCRKCNFNEMTHRSQWAKVDGVFWRTFGPERMMELSRRSEIKVKWGRAEYQAKIEEAKVWLKNIMGGQVA